MKYKCKRHGRTITLDRGGVVHAKDLHPCDTERVVIGEVEESRRAYVEDARASIRRSEIRKAQRDPKGAQ